MALMSVSVSVAVDADFTNFFEIVSAAEDSVTDGTLTCTIAIAAPDCPVSDGLEDREPALDRSNHRPE